MEAVGVGANVLAFVVLGIKSAKLAHDTLSAIKDGPAIVQSLAASFLQLHYILEQLLQSRAAARDTALHGQARQCCEDLDKLANTIERLQVPPKEKATGRFWKRLKTAISENDLKRLDAWVAQQASMLSLRLNVLSSNEIYATRDGNERIQQKIELMGTSMQTQFESQTANFLGAAMSITSNRNDERSALEAGLSSIQQTIETTHSISSKDTQSMFELLKEIKDRIAPESNGGAGTTSAIDGGERAEAVASLDLDQKMLESIDSLCSLIGEKRNAVDAYGEDDGQAESAIEDLEGLVQTLRKQKLPVSDAKSFENDLGRFSKWFGSGALSINSGAAMSRRPPTRVIEQIQGFHEADIGVGRFSLRVQKRKRAIDTEDHDDNDTRAVKRCHTDWNMTLAFLPDSDRGQNRHMLLASLTRQTNTMSSISRLQVNRVLPAESLVFKLVRQGNLRGLKEMLQDGRASLQDHDEYGASLLFYSMRQPEVCKFLLDSGLDVDHVANGSGYDKETDGMVQALQLPSVTNQLFEECGQLRRVTECRKLLLRAGADPTFELDTRSFLQLTNIFGGPETIELAWNPEIVAPFANIKTYRDKGGRCSLLTACAERGDFYTKEVFRQLLRAGADIRNKDWRGRTCLHICLSQVGSPPTASSVSDWDDLGVIEYLVQQGADPRAIDNHGRSVSDIAYNANGCTDTITSCAGDLWDAVLHRCGYNITQFRSGYRRRARYTTAHHNRVVDNWLLSGQYNRSHFEELWKGREAECPYWDDEPWPPLKPGEEDGDHESQDLECRCEECQLYYSYLDSEQSDSSSELDTEADGEQPSSDNGGSADWQHHLGSDLDTDQDDDEQSESDMEEVMSMGNAETFWNETGTLPGFGELTQGMSGEDWHDSPNLQPSIVGTPRSLSMDLENPWL